MLQKFLLSIFLLSIPILTTAQERRPTDSTTVKSIPRTGIISGQITDVLTGQPVEFASVAVFSVRDSVLRGGNLSNEKGKFTVTELPSIGRYRVRISFIGFAEWTSDVIHLTPEKSSYDLGLIRMASSDKNLKEVNITAEKSDFQNGIDKKVYNVDKNLVNSGGTATDVLQNIPSVSVDMDGNVSLRGSNAVTIYIDGRPSTLTGASREAILQQIPASVIESIEVVTNPSAKYDAEGMAGIINIKTKKGRLQGLNGTITTGVGTNNKYNLATTLNNRGPKLNIYGSYAFRSEEREAQGEGFQQFRESNLFNSISSKTFGEQKNIFHTGKAGLDYSISNTATLGVSGSYSTRKEEDPEQNTNLIDYTTLPDEVSLRYELTDEFNETIEGTVDYKKTFEDGKREFTSSASYSITERTDDRNYSGTLSETPYQLNSSNAENSSAVLQADYLHSFKQSKLETGIKGSQRVNDRDVNALIQKDGIYINDIQYTNHFIYEENILAAYALYSGKLSFFDFSLGVRAEETSSTGDSRTSDITVKNNYLSLFPSAALKYNWKKTNDVQLVYSRRTNRPNINSLNPFVDYSDTLNIRTGNPYLLPEYIHSAELSYGKTIEKFSATATLYYRHIDDLISRYRIVDVNTGVSTFTILNFSSADNTGLESIIRYQMNKGNIMWSFNIFQNTVNGENVDPDITGTNTNWNTRLTGSYKVHKNVSIQLTGMYSAPDRQPQRTIRNMMSGVDAGIKYDFSKGRASLNLSVTDIFKTRKFDIHIEQDAFVYDGIRQRESQVATLTFMYRFGTQDNPFTSRKRNQKSPVIEGGGENNDMGF